jgi:hypothetical protein
MIFWPSSNGDHLSYFRFIGKMIGCVTILQKADGVQWI